MTNDGQTARLPPVNKAVRDEFRQFVEETHGMVRGHYKSNVERALRSYMDAYQGGDIHDELRRLREQIENLEGGASGETTGSGGDSVSKTTEDRIADIMADIRDRADELDSPRVREEDVEAAIERNAGASYKTLQRYKKLLQNQRELFAHPSIDDVFFVRPAAFIACVEQGGDGKLRPDEGRDIRDAYGDEWWIEHAPSGMLDEDKRGFQ